MLPWRSARWADTFSAPPPPSYFLGSATSIDTNAGYARLTPDAESQSGRLMLTELLRVEHFDMQFRGWFGRSTAANGSGADGIVFLFAPLFDYAESGGGTLNFDGCLGYGVEFDTYQNSELGDRSEEHVAVIKDGSWNHLQSEILAAPTLEDSRWHDLRIRFRAGLIEVFIDGTRRLDTQIADFFPFDGFFGFSSATGFAYNEHRVDDVTLSLPSRLSADLGAVSVCGGAALDTAVIMRNNHPDGLPLTITTVALESTPPGAFILAGNPAPVTVPPGGDLRIPVLFRSSDAGKFRAVLRLEASNGESVYDTLRIIAEEPQLMWEPSSAVFPLTRIGSTSTLTATLRNTGRVPAEISGLRWPAGSAGDFAADLALPVILFPGDSLAVSMRFTPSTSGLSLDTLLLETSCGDGPVLPLSGAGSTESLVFRLQSPLLLSPGETDGLLVLLDSLPAGVAVEELRFRLRYDATVLRFVEPAAAGGLSQNAAFTPAAGTAGDEEFRLTEPGGLQGTGPLFVLRMRAEDEGLLCRDVRLDWEIVRPYALSGVTEAAVCINPSCRHPEGLHRAALPGMLVTPQPARDHLTVRLDSPASIAVTLRLYDARGREVRTLFDGLLPEGMTVIDVPAGALSSGFYTLHLRSSEGARVLPVMFGR